MSQSLVQRVRTHLMDERINCREEADAEMMLMTHVELVEVISFVLDDMLAGRPTHGAGQYPGFFRRRSGRRHHRRSILT
ncbi:hypothetical protein [Bradyrhizobium sp. SZCCHNR3118]|uniref:hypothetical protein n=1 Tax=Bradyrhizobium sp. SZCCHNR3118 TaxID=3057468 RepID=UPI002916B3FD|nr:hypothetical protein [Bradyrhizobium sp. SZCCHNR3118]